MTRNPAPGRAVRRRSAARRVPAVPVRALVVRAPVVRALVVRALVVLTVATGCVTPARTPQMYEAKAGLTAQDALAALETARLGVHTAQSGKLPDHYLQTLLDESEDAFDSVASTFQAVQPPADRDADALGEELDGLLEEGSQGLRQLRILARRHRGQELADASAGLDELAHRLSGFAEEHRR